MRPRIYLDHNASAPLDPEVFEVMKPYWLATGNPESRHGFARSQRAVIEDARERLAAILNARPSEVVFTSGGTEANNLALLGLARRPGSTSRRVVVSPIEHPAVGEPIDALEAEGFEVARSSVGLDGVVETREFSTLLSPETSFASLILAHNETGALQPVQAVSEQARELGIPVHTDAVQAVGRIPVDFRALGVATLAISAHKFHGPAGIGALLIRDDLTLAPLLRGGGQQRGRRPGTPATALIVGMAEALDRWHREREERIRRWTGLRDRLESRLFDALGPERVVRNGPNDPALRLPQTTHLGFPNLDGDSLLLRLDMEGIAVSIGSACASGSTQPSPSFLAMRIPEDRLRSSVRFSLGATTTVEEIDACVRRIVRVVGSETPLRATS